MRKLIGPLVLFLIAIVFWLSDRPSAVTTGSDEKSANVKTDDANVAKNKADTKDLTDTKVAKKKTATNDSADTKVSDDIFPQKYLTNWETDEGLLSLMRAPGTETIRGVYYHPVRTNELRGKIVTSYISRRSAAVLTGFWFQTVSDKKCNFKKNGTYYWGRMSFLFKGDSFKGVWGYCGDEADYSWNGKRA